MSRKLSVHELFNILQEEYIICRLRSTIYLKSHLKEYWGRVADGKKRKILDIAKKNSLPCIFDHKDIEKEYSKRVFRVKGYPHFYYTSKEAKGRQEYWDLWNYYYKESPVKVFFDDKEAEKGIVVENNIEEKKVTVEIEGKRYVQSMEKVTRIF